MIKYKFKLEALLKVRSFKEKNIKIELGKIVKEVEEVKSRISKIHLDIDESYKSQDALSSEIISGQVLRFLSYFVQGKKDDLASSNELLGKLQEKFNLKLKELAEARGQTKILEKMRDDDFEKYKKETEKKRYMQIEEMFNMRSNGEDQ